MALIKGVHDSLKNVLNQWMYTRTLQPQTQRDLQSRFGKPQKVIIVASFVGDNEKAYE